VKGKLFIYFLVAAEVSMKRISLMELCNGLSLGGTERAMQEFALNLDKKRFNVSVGAVDTSGPRRKVLEKAGIKVIRIDMQNLERQLRENKIDVVHAHSLPIASIVGKVRTINEVVFSGNYLEAADMNLIISKSLACKISRAKKGKDFAYGKNFYVLYYPQNVESWDRHALGGEALQKLRERNGIKNEDFIIGRIGRAEPSKTDFLVLKSAPLIARRIAKAKFLFVGLPWLYRAILSRNRHLKGRLIFREETGDDRKLAEYYQLMDAFWHTAGRGETFGSVNAEAMIFRKPVVTHSTPFRGKSLAETRDNAQVEVVEHLRTGIVANHPEEVAGAFHFLYSHPEKRRRLGEAGRARVIRDFEARKICSQLESVAMQVCAGRKAAVSPSGEEVEDYIRRGYNKAKGLSFSPVNGFQRASYAAEKKAYSVFLEFPYLVLRFLLRKLGIDIEG
jgi:glycosyltransferase involved in cell wall biosynthesis